MLSNVNDLNLNIKTCLMKIGDFFKPRWKNSNPNVRKSVFSGKAFK